MHGIDSDNVLQCFQLLATERPDCFAIRSGTERLTYGQLDTKANVLRDRLAVIGAEGTLAGVLLGRSLSAVISYLGVLKAGAAFVPLDPGVPEQNLLDILRSHTVRCIISDTLTMQRFPQLASTAAVCDVDAAALAGATARGESAKISGSDPACVMFTSGSTGEPKGVVIPHRAIVRLVKNPGYMRFSADQIFLQASALTFDASIFEIWGALLNGAELVIPEAGLLSLDAIAAAIDNEGVTTLFLTSGLFNLMVDQRPEALRNLRYLVSGGDVMSPVHVAKAAHILESGLFISVYGPTENTTFTTTFTAPRDFTGDAPVPIGWPVAGTILRIFDDAMRLVADGEPGELYVGGTGLALGYLNAPSLTQQKFVADPQSPSQKLYRTGDLVRRDKNGLLHFLGRMDNQIKINGIRVEPEHVETILRRNLPLSDIAVVACPLPSGAKHLVAFVVPQPGAGLSNTTFREAAACCLSPHMIPSRLELVEEFPLTRTGKIDRLALSRTAAAAREQKPGSIADAPSSEATLIALWRRHLQLEKIDIDQNFFDLGGTSLQLLAVHADLEELFPGRLLIQDLFDLPTIRLLKSRLGGNQMADATAQAAARAALQRGARAARAPLPVDHANIAGGD
jgi:amino acid adenylation domain-containing protein